MITVQVTPETARDVLAAAERAGQRQAVSSWPIGIDLVAISFTEAGLSRMLAYWTNHLITLAAQGGGGYMDDRRPAVPRFPKR